MRIGWIGFHVEGILALRAVIEHGYPIQALITLDEEHAVKRSGVADYTALCAEFSVPYHEVGNINSGRSVTLLNELDLDIAFVIGWSQIVRDQALGLVRTGMIGAHASLLPHHRGRAPINWALIKGEEETGNTLMWLVPGVDRGDIIDQTRIPISPYDTCASLYQKVAESNRDMILRLLPRLLAGERPGQPQSHIDEPELPGRRPEDGQLDWSAPASNIYNLVRGVTRPYPGAFSWLDGKRWTIWHCALLPEAFTPDAESGQVLGPLVSPVDEACGVVVACGRGAVVLLELEGDNGEILKGHQLSNQGWIGKRWHNA